MNDKLTFLKQAWLACVSHLEKISDDQSERIFNDIINRYCEPHRKWHNIDHLYNLVLGTTETDFFECDYETSLEFIPKILLAIFFHDIIYDPTINDNEEKSAKYFSDTFNSKITNEFKSDVIEAILNTKNLVTKKSDGVVKYIVSKLDTEILYSNDILELINWENGIYKEYQFHGYEDYKKGRVDFLTKAYTETRNKKLIELIDIVMARKPRVGLYVGSFNPFHIGHNNIMEQAENMFDAVIIGVGINSAKNNTVEQQYLPKYRHIIKYDSLVTELIEKMEEHYDVTLIRGIRNSSDLEYEKNYIATLKDLKCDLKHVLILSNPELHHISSSMIRELKRFNGDWKKYVKNI